MLEYRRVLEGLLSGQETALDLSDLHQEMKNNGTEESLEFLMDLSKMSGDVEQVAAKVESDLFLEGDDDLDDLDDD